MVRFDPEQQQQFARDGFLIVENVLAIDAIEQIRTMLDALQRDRANVKNVPRLRRASEIAPVWSRI